MGEDLKRLLAKIFCSIALTLVLGFIVVFGMMGFAWIIEEYGPILGLVCAFSGLGIIVGFFMWLDEK